MRKVRYMATLVYAKYLLDIVVWLVAAVYGVTKSELFAPSRPSCSWSGLGSGARRSANRPPIQKSVESRIVINY